MKSPKFSIIIPARNEEDLIKRAIDSILNQTFQDFELIVSNDGSTDKTSKIVGEIMRKDKRVKILDRKEGHSAAFARNRGAENSHGEILIFLDADCTLNKYFLEKIYENRGAGDAFAVNCFAIENSLVNYALSGLTTTIVLKKKLWSRKDPNPPMFFSITRKAFDAIEGYDEKIFYFEDEDFAKRFYKKGFTTVFVKGTSQHFELPSTFQEFLRQCSWIAKGIKSLRNPDFRRKQKNLWFFKSLFLLSPLFALPFSKNIFLILLGVTSTTTYVNLLFRNKNPLKSLISLLFVYIKTFYVTSKLFMK